MRHVFATVIILAFVFLSVPAVAEPETIDLATMSLEELIDLQSRVFDALVNSDEWLSVTVPVGTYQIGVEIPAGKWTISAREGEYTSFSVVDSLNATGTGVDENGKYYHYGIIASESSFIFEEYPVPSFTINLEEGMYFIIEDAPLIFTMPVAPAFTFGK